MSKLIGVPKKSLMERLKNILSSFQQDNLKRGEYTALFVILAYNAEENGKKFVRMELTNTLPNAALPAALQLFMHHIKEVDEELLSKKPEIILPEKTDEEIPENEQL